MSTAYPILRSTREKDCTATAGQTVFGPADFLVVSIDDVQVWLKTASGGGRFQLQTAGFTVSLSGVTGLGGYPSVTFASGRVADDIVRIRGARVHDRQTDVTRAGALQSALLEHELDLQALVLQEVRRDASLAVEAAELIAQVVNSGPVQAVNGKSGDVVIDASDIEFTAGVPVGQDLGARVRHVASVAALLAVLPAVAQAAHVAAYHAGTGIGGGVFVWDASRAKSAHNGGSIISPTVPWDGSQAALSAFLAGTGEASPAGTGCWVRVGHGREVRPEWFGARGDGTTDDGAAFAKLAAIGAKRIRLDVASYYWTGEVVFSGRVEIIGSAQQSVIKGRLKYAETAFPVAADTLTPLTPAAPHLYVDSVAFDCADANYFGLSIVSDYSTQFEDTFTLNNCVFYGINGLTVRHGYNATLTGCVFNSRDKGAWMEGCTNITYDGCRWNNQRNVGLNITIAPDVNTRLGGELHKLVNCQFAVCTTGIKALLSRWLTIDNVLLDYCAAPVVLYGCKDHLVSNSYFGASNAPVARFAGQPGYAAPDVQDIAFYGAAYTFSSSVYAIGGTHDGNWYVNYRGAGNPLFWFNAAGAAGTYTTDMLRMTSCTFLVDASQPHTMNYYLVADKATNVSIVGNYFEALTNPSGSMVEYYSLPSCDGERVYCAGNKTRNALDGGAIMAPPDFEQPDFIGYGVKNAQPLKFRRASGSVVPILQVTAGDITQMMIPVNTTGKFQIVDQSGTVLFEVGQTATKLLCAGTLRTIGNGNADTAGAGYRTAIFPNNG